MNVRKLGVPIYENELGQQYVTRADLKLALDRDVYERLIENTAEFVMDDGVLRGYSIDWLENQR